eukprot:7385027-Prymnesium_polylepis.1
MVERTASMEAKKTKVAKKRDELPAGRTADFERYEKHAKFLADRLEEAASYTARLAAHGTAVDALSPQAPSVAQTSLMLLALVDDDRALLDKGFGFAHTAASK